MRLPRVRSRIRARLFAYFAAIALLVALAMYLCMYLVISPSLKTTAYEALRDSAHAQMSAVDQSVRSLNSVSVSIVYASQVRGYMERLNAQGRLGREEWRALTNQLVSINGPMFPASQIRLYSLSGVMVAVGMVNGQYTYDPGALPWMETVLREDGAKVLALPQSDPALVKTSRYIALRRVIKQNHLQTLGVVEVVADTNRLLSGLLTGGSMQVHLLSDEGGVIYPPSGQVPEAVRQEILASEGTSGVRELPGELIAWRRSSECNWTLAAVLPRAEALAPLNAITKFTLAIACALVIMALLLSYLASRQFTRPIHALAGRMANFELTSSESPQPQSTGLDELAALNNSFDELKTRLAQSVDELMLTKQQELQSHMMALQSQMNPHFLFNALSNLEALVDLEENERAVEMIGNLSRMLRYIGSDKEPLVPLRDELRHVLDYIDCMKLRFGANLSATVHPGGALLDIPVPKLCIQPLVENAIKYGCTASPPWQIGVSVHNDSGNWYAEISDCGPGFDRHTLNTLLGQIECIRKKGVLPGMQIGGMGLLNIAMRLKLYAGEDFLFHIQNLDGGGCRIVIGNNRGGESK